LILTSLFTSSIDKVIDSVSNLINDNFTSDDERNTAKNALAKIKAEANLQAQQTANQYEAELTKRLQSDNEHLVTRLVRPAVVVFLYVLFGGILLFDGNIGGFAINPLYITSITSLLGTVTGFYFGSRGAEKIAKAIGSKI
jgi:hypothetical protein